MVIRPNAGFFKKFRTSGSRAPSWCSAPPASPTRGRRSTWSPHGPSS